ncbi:MAG: hypothetical protein B6I38_11285 [Anaerolineaceae bacterium 4572_5.1]|nr:MAG: hypothetical protein B6I38_11285 [Anaerolineaceae bacterium 4572_5.1]
MSPHHLRHRQTRLDQSQNPHLAVAHSNCSHSSRCTLISQWRIAIVAIAVVAAVATPTPDPINMLIAMAPMIVLYLFSALLAYIAQL